MVPYDTHTNHFFVYLERTILYVLYINIFPILGGFIHTVLFAVETTAIFSYKFTLCNTKNRNETSKEGAGWAKLVVFLSVLFAFSLAANFAWIDSEVTDTFAMASKAEEYKTQGNDLFQKV